jgi:integrase
MKTKEVKATLNFFQLYDKLIGDLQTGRKRLPNGKLYKKESINVYLAVRKNLFEFCQERDFELRLRKVKGLNQRQLVIERNYWKKFYRKFTDYMHNTRGHHDNYVGGHMKSIRAFLNYVRHDLLLDIGNFNRQLHVYKEEIPVIVLTPEQLHFLIYNKEFEDSLPGRLQRVKDTFVVGCSIALRYSDLMALTRANILRSDNKYYLSVRSKKTKTYTQVKLPDYAVTIIQKYKGAGTSLLPQISKFNLNKYLKELIEKAGWVEPIGKYREKRGTIKEIKKDGAKYRFCDHISSHTMRRTAITTMLTLDVPEHIVRSISGHSPMSKEFFRYVAIAQIYKDREMDKMHERLKMVG